MFNNTAYSTNITYIDTRGREIETLICRSILAQGKST